MELTNGCYGSNAYRLVVPECHTEDEAAAAKQMTMDEARRVASNIAKL
jgi:hypothetical protein